MCFQSYLYTNGNIPLFFLVIPKPTHHEKSNTIVMLPGH